MITNKFKFYVDILDNLRNVQDCIGMISDIILTYSEFASKQESELNDHLFKQTIDQLTKQSEIDHDFLFESRKGKSVKIHVPAFKNGNGVFQPNFFVAPIWFANTVAAIIGDKIESGNGKILKICEMGTGSGIGSTIYAQEQNTQLLALDINPFAVETAIVNFKINGVLNAKAKVSDLYENVGKDEKFDICTWNPPFRIASDSKNLIEGAIADKDGKLLAKYLFDSKDYLLEVGEIYIVFSKIGFSYIEYLASVIGYKLSIVAQKSSNLLLGKATDQNFEFLILKFEPIYEIKTKTEWHLHIDSFMPAGYLRESIPEFYTDGGLEHNFDHFLRDHQELSIFHGNEPTEHASKYYSDSPQINQTIQDYAQILLEKLEKLNFRGYLEYERVTEVDQNYNQDQLVIPKLDFSCARKKCTMDSKIPYYETHFTIPIEFLQENHTIFKKLSLKGVSLDKKDSLKYAVMTGLYLDKEIAKKVFEYLASMKSKFALKFEKKWFVLPKSAENIELECLFLL